MAKSKTNSATTLQVVGKKADSLESMPDLAGWKSIYLEVSASRAGGEHHPLVLPPEGLVEFELAGGERILVATDNIGAYLGAGSRGATDGTYQMGETLQPEGLQAETGRGIGAWIVKAIRIAAPQAARPAARALAEVLQAKALGSPPGFYKVGATPAQLTPMASAPGSTEPLLVLIHGTMSSTDGSFGDLWAGQHRTLIQDRFDDRIYALQHNTLTDSPVANALAIARALPPSARVHLLTHSRGGLVGELLARGGRENGPAFTDEEIQWLTESAAALDRPGYDEIAKQLRALTKELDAKKFRIERFVRVACPARGTTLLAGRLDRWASTVVNLISGAAGLAGPAGKATGAVLEAVHAFAAAVVAERRSAATLPGLEAMTPDSPLVALLNNDESKIDGSLHVVAGDYQGNTILKYLADAFAERYYGGNTDLVVNTASMHGGAQRVGGIYRQFFGGSEGYHHLNYFAKQHSSRAVALALTDARHDSVPGFERLTSPSRELIARGGKTTMPKKDAPILFILPGIMGSALQRDGDTIWFNFFRVALGGIRKLGIGETGVGPAGWLDRSYEDLAKALSDTYEIWPFAYDWRLSIAAEAARFRDELDRAIEAAHERKQPVRILAHSMGGLVARLALSERWDAFKSVKGSRLVQLGTPNGGSAAIGAVLLARDRFVNLLTTLDIKHSTKEFLEVINKYPGVLELMAWQSATDSSTDFFDPAQWKRWEAADVAATKEASKDSGGHGGTVVGQRTYHWDVPAQEALAAAKAVTQAIAGTTLDKDATVYVAGWAKETPVDVVLVGNTVTIKTVPDGDGRVPWKTGIPKDVPTYYADVAHGDLPAEKPCFAAYRQLLATGETALLPNKPPQRRGIATVAVDGKAEELHALYPSVEEVLAAAIGGTVRPPDRPSLGEPDPVEVVIIHGSLATAEDPVIIGAYAYDALRGTAKYVDERLAGRLEKSRARGTYPNFPGEAQAFLQRSAGARPTGAITVGLGTVGTTSPGDLSRAYQAGLLAYANALDNQPHRGDDPEQPRLDVATLIIGTGFGGLSVETSLRALLDAIAVVAQKTARAPATPGTQNAASVQSPSLRRVTIYERADNRAVAAALALCRLIREPKYSGKIFGTTTVRPGKGGFRALVLDDAGSNGVRRVHITQDKQADTVQFTLITDRARNPVEIEPSLLRDIDGLLKRSTSDVSDKPGVARAMFELLVPNDFKEGLADTGALILGVDYETAAYPWELLRDAPTSVAPLCTRIPVVRQLATARGRQNVALARGNAAFVVGDTDSGFARLPGAEKEAATVAGLLRGAGWDVEPLIHPGPDEVFAKLFDTEYRILHLACHGIAEPPFAEDDPERFGKRKPRVGAVLSKDVMLSAAHVSKLRRVPEFVFLNCCHLGDTKLEDANRWARLAANLAVQFIEMGARAVVAAGWEVQDSAGTVFASRLYAALLEGRRFGDALRLAREETWRQYPNTNTWGAYQAYGDERFHLKSERLPGKAPEQEVAPCPAIEHRAVLLARLEELRADAEVESESARKADILQSLDDMAKQAGASFKSDARVHSAFGYGYTALRAWDSAIKHFEYALTAENAEIDLRAVERLADAETRRGAELVAARSGKETDGWAMMDRALGRLKNLVAIQPSVERYCLSAANHKRRAELARPAKPKTFLAELACMVEHYGLAVKLGEDAGRVSYYPDANQLFGQYVLREHGHLSKPEVRAIDKSVDARVERMIEDARRKAAEEDEFFHLVAEADARLVGWLWKWSGAPGAKAGPAGVDDIDMHVNALSSLYAVAVQRFGSAREMDSTYRQFKSVADMLPPTAKASPVLAGLRDAVEAKVKR